MTKDVYKIPELKKCPYCGGKASVKEALGDHFYGGRIFKGYFVSCNSCGASTGSSTYTHFKFVVDTRLLLAIRNWNIRHLEGTFACPECGVDVPHKHDNGEVILIK